MLLEELMRQMQTGQIAVPGTADPSRMSAGGPAAQPKLENMTFMPGPSSPTPAPSAPPQRQPVRSVVPQPSGFDDFMSGASGQDLVSGLIGGFANMAIGPERRQRSEAIKAQEEAKANAIKNQTAQFLMRKHGLGADEAAVVASNPALLQPFLKPQDPNADLARRVKEMELKKAEADLARPTRKLENVGGRLMDLTDPANPVDVTPKEKLEERMSFEQNKVDLKTVDRYVKDAEDADAMLGDVMSLEAARAETSREGPTFGIIPKDYLPDLTPTAQRIASTAENVRLSFVQKTKGAVSDAEMKVFGSATPTMGMADSAAQPILDFMKLGAQRTKERASFFDAWMRTKGSLKGSQEAWKQFTEDNPLLAQSEGGAFELNPQNVGNWEGYLTGEAKAKPKGASAAPTDKAAQAEAIRRAMRGGQ